MTADLHLGPYLRFYVQGTGWPFFADAPPPTGGGVPVRSTLDFAGSRR